MKNVRLHRLAHARAGDKGNTSNVSVVAYDDAAWRLVRDFLTAARVAQAFAHLTHETVTRHELPQLRALNFVIPGALAGGVTRSLALDAHGKSLSYLLLDIELPIPTTMETP
jgi:hypothetical protein